jgi:hypothetical protein
VGVGVNSGHAAIVDMSRAAGGQHAAGSSRGAGAAVAPIGLLLAWQEPVSQALGADSRAHRPRAAGGARTTAKPASHLRTRGHASQKRSRVVTHGRRAEFTVRRLRQPAVRHADRPSPLRAPRGRRPAGQPRTRGGVGHAHGRHGRLRSRGGRGKTRHDDRAHVQRGDAGNGIGRTGERRGRAGRRQRANGPTR